MTMPIWKLLQADLRDFTSTHPSANSDSASSGMVLARLQRLLPVLEQQNSLFAVLTLPLAELAAALPDLSRENPAFVPLAAELLRRYQIRTQQAPSLGQAIELLGQAAYLDQFCATFQRPKIQRWIGQVGQAAAAEAVQHQFRILTGLKLEGQDARQAVVAFSTSRLATVLNRLLAARLTQLGLQPAPAQQIAAQIAFNTEPQILPALEQAGAAMQPWVAWYRDDDADRLERHLRLDAYLDDYIQPRPAELVFNESFSLRDIYVPLKAQILTSDGEPDFDQPPVDLEEWTKAQLSQTEADQVLLVQGGFGRGKSTFCRMFADWVRQQQYPRWTPVLIPLQELRSLGNDFEELLRQAVPSHWTQDPDWLAQGDTRFLFLLDGFSELNLEDNSSLEQFFQQVGKFQESCASQPEMGHRIIITGRSLMIKTLERLLPPNLARVEILPFDAALQTRWLAQWERLTGAATSSLKAMLQNIDVPEQNAHLTREPLMLYFLAAMHRDGELRLDMLEETNVARAKFLLYQQIFYWALTRHRPGLLQRQLSPTEIESLRRLLAEVGLWAVQTGSETVPLAQIATRLQHDQEVQALLAELQTKLQDHALTNPLVTLYSRGDQSYIRFTHNSFGKLFCSRRLHEALEDWATTLTRRQKPEPLVPTETMNWQIFDLLGYGGLTAEMTEYLMVLLNANPDLDATYLFKRLESFYWRWCGGQFMDAPPESLPQKASRLLRQPHPALGQRQADIYAGFNVMILLLELHRYARSQNESQDEIAFYPCGRQGSPDFVPERLLRMIGYSHCVSPSAFRAIVGPYLSGTNLSGVVLTGTDLSGIDFSGADLRSADLSRTHLRGANLSRANLVGASLDGANLSSADLRGANLIGANLRGADLSSASLSGADLSSANLVGASLSRADLRDADLSGAYLRGASLQSADLSRAYLIGASLSGASLNAADLGHVDLSDANLHGADLSDVNLRHADLSGADLIGAYLNGASLCGASLCNASLNSADLIGADLCGADLSSANLIGAELSDLTAGEVKWSERTKWEDVRGLDAAVSVPEALKHQLGLG